MENNKNYSFIKEIVTQTVRLRLLPDRIIHYTYLPNSEVDDLQHQINHEALLKLIDDGQKYPALLDGDDFANVTPEGRKMVRELEPFIPVSDRAMIIKQLAQRILANFYIKIQKPIIPTKIFNNHDDALKWLHLFK